MSLRLAFEDKIKLAREKLNELKIKKEQGEKIDEEVTSNLLIEVLGEEPPDPIIYLAVSKMGLTSEEKEEDVVTFIKKEFSDDLFFILKEVIRLAILTNQIINEESLKKELENQLKWIGILDNLNK